jgi:hypothetical protein
VNRKLCNVCRSQKTASKKVGKNVEKNSKEEYSFALFCCERSQNIQSPKNPAKIPKFTAKP